MYTSKAFALAIMPFLLLGLSTVSPVGLEPGLIQRGNSQSTKCSGEIIGYLSYRNQ